MFDDFYLAAENRSNFKDFINAVAVVKVENVSRLLTLTPLTFLAYLPENKGMQTEWSPQDLNLGPLALHHHDPLCQTTLCRCPASEFVLIYSFA